EAVTVYGPSTHPPGATLQNAMQIQLRQEALDNNTPALDDLAGILEALLKNQHFLEAFVAEPFEISEDSTISVTRIQISDAVVNLVAGTGCLDTTIILGETKGEGGSVEIDLHAVGTAAFLGDEILLSAKSIRIEGQICPQGQDESLTLEIRDPRVTFDGFLLATDQYPDLAEDFPGTTAALADAAEDALARWIGESLADLVFEMLEGFGEGYAFGTAPVVTADFGLQRIQVGPFGLLIDFSASFSAPTGFTNLPPSVGSLRTDDSALSGGFSQAPVAVAMSDDALNQLLFANWYGAGIADYEMPVDELDALPEVFQPLSRLEVSVALPPTFVAPKQPEYAFDLATGGVALELLSGSNRHFDMELHIQAGVSIILDEEGAISLDLDNRAQRITVHANVTTAPPEHDRGDLAALLRMMVPTILGQVGVTYGGFPIPSFDLAAFSDNLSSFQGRTISFAPESFGRGGEGGGYFVVEGAIRED
ncbi:MAG: hypothetical protein ACNA8W_12140, partial [Bradymonadaceae bacterium]